MQTCSLDLKSIRRLSTNQSDPTSFSASDVRKSWDDVGRRRIDGCWSGSVEIEAVGHENGYPSTVKVSAKIEVDLAVAKIPKGK